MAGALRNWIAGTVLVALASVFLFWLSFTATDGITGTEARQSVFGAEPGSGEMPPVEHDNTSSSPIDMVLTFPDGTQIDYVLHTYAMPTGVPVESTIEDFDDLVLKANAGDAVTAYYLSKTLHYCTSNPQDVAKVAGLIASMLQPGNRANVPDDELRIGIRALEDHISEQSKRCYGLTEAQIATNENNRWLELAADNGHARAQFELGIRLTNKGHPKAEGYLKSAWESGMLQAASHLRYFYSRNKNPQFHDRIQAFAYGYLYWSISNGILQLPEHTEGRAARIAANEWKLQKEREVLTTTEVASAIDMAKRLLEENTACCYAR